MMGWDFTQGGEAAPRVRPPLCELGAAVEAALVSPAARMGAAGAVLALRGVVCRFGLGWRLEVDEGCVVVRCGRKRVVLSWWEGWRELPPWGKSARPVGEALAGL